MKNITHKIYVSAVCLLSLILVCNVAEAQKSKSRRSTARTTKSRSARTTKRTTTRTTAPTTEPAFTRTPEHASVAPVTAQAVPDTADMPIDTIVPMDGYYKNTLYTRAKSFAYPAVNSNDVRFYKRVWRDIDLKDPKNMLLNTPGSTLASVVLEGVKLRRITAYQPSITNSDSTFAKPLRVSHAMGLLQDSAMVDQFDANGNKVGSKMVLNDFNPERITKFRIKEDIYFDKKRSLVVSRIIGIAPLKSIQAGGQEIGEAPVFWLYFPQCRDYFATKDLSDPERKLYDTSLDDIFLQKKYSSVIVRSTGTTNNGQAGASDPALQLTAAQLSATNANQNTQASSEAVEAKIQNFKNETWDYKVQQKPVSAKSAKKEKPAKAVKPVKTDKASK
ncbi:gliding motility protein GldN [Mucilaginibacter robiniae]|uniref:Gliding motility protein GldN n=1 Tax=Mucilaginibacter robiniae TaxID=2728022 RepID=A0A7L5E7Y0_9SPHI|nr:gliding motility protein GldN [Mucilaginibacter robiniae]QJD96963.1 gliding motility protein GldN [Mucilaginibacter robiniae]